MKIHVLFAALYGVCILSVAEAETPTHLKCLWSSYRNFKISADNKSISFKNNGVMPYKDRMPVGTPVDRKNLTSIDQMFLRPYPYGFRAELDGRSYPIPTAADELIGARYQPLFKALYGQAPAQVENDLVSVKWVDGSLLQFNRRYGAANALQKVIKKLNVLIAARPELKKYLYHPAGTYNWRNISHEKALSVHAFGAAIDINIKYADYWLWDIGADHRIHYRNRIPIDIARVFEEYGFIWGGKWYHYDTMHFEFRPELLMSAQDCEDGFKAYRD